MRRYWEACRGNLSNSGALIHNGPPESLSPHFFPSLIRTKVGVALSSHEVGRNHHCCWEPAAQATDRNGTSGGRSLLCFSPTPLCHAVGSCPWSVGSGAVVPFAHCLRSPLEPWHKATGYIRGYGNGMVAALPSSILHTSAMQKQYHRRLSGKSHTSAIT